MSTGLSPLFVNQFSDHFWFSRQEYAPMYYPFTHVSETDMRIVDEQEWQSYGSPYQRNPGEAMNAIQFAQSFSKRFVVQNYGAIDYIPMEDIEDDMYGVLTRVIPGKAGELVRAFEVLIEILLANWFTVNGFASGTIPYMDDSLSFFNSNHPTSQQITTPISNLLSGNPDMSVASVAVALTMLQTQLRPNGREYIANNGVGIVTNPMLNPIAFQIINGMMEPGTSDRNLNYVKKFDLKHVAWPYFQSAGPVGASNNFYDSWMMWGEDHTFELKMRMPPKPYCDFDLETLSYMYAAAMRLAYGAVNWRGWVASQGQ